MFQYIEELVFWSVHTATFDPLFRNVRKSCFLCHAHMGIIEPSMLRLNDEENVLVLGYENACVRLSIGHDIVFLLHSICLFGASHGAVVRWACCVPHVGELLEHVFKYCACVCVRVFLPFLIPLCFSSLYLVSWSGSNDLRYWWCRSAFIQYMFNIAVLININAI